MKTKLLDASDQKLYFKNFTGPENKRNEHKVEIRDSLDSSYAIDLGSGIRLPSTAGAKPVKFRDFLV